MKIMLANFTKMVDDSGGLAKVTCAFANKMFERGHDIVLAYSDEQDGDFFYPIDEKIACYDLRQLEGQRVAYPIYLKVYREIMRAFDTKSGRRVNDLFFEKYLLKNLKSLLDKFEPDIIVAFQPAASKALLCDLAVHVPVITMSHGDPEDYFHVYPKEELPALEKSAVCQVLLPSFEQHIKNHLPKVNTITIGNAVPQFVQQADLAKTKELYRVIFVGRLAKQHKRPHLLIEAFIKIADKFPQWQLELWGAKDGEVYFKQLEEMISKAGMKQRIFIRGATDNVPAVLQEGDIFAFPSAFEGFGLSLAEAMSMGLPTIGYKS